jgi:hypothetical protein
MLKNKYNLVSFKPELGILHFQLKEMDLAARNRKG